VEIKYFTKKELVEANQEAIRRNFNETLTQKALDQLSDKNKFPIIFHVSGGTKETVKTELLLSPERPVWLELTSNRFDALPYLEVDYLEMDEPTRH
jgi:hypothetical protein